MATTRVLVSEQVENFVRSLAPDPRKRLTRAIKMLAAGRGDVRALEGNLAGYSRLSVGGYRVVFKEQAVEGQRTIACFFAERRALVYALVVGLLAERAASPEG